MSKTVQQIFATNPVTTILNTDLLYLVNSPYTPGTDAAITGANLKALFAPAAGSTSIITLGTITTGVWNGTPIDLGSFVSGNLSVSHLNSGISSSNTTFWRGDGTWATPSGTSPLTTKGDIYVFSTINDRLPVAVGDGKFLQVSAGAGTGLAWSTSTIPASAGATANKVLLSDGTNYVLSTPTFPNASATAGKFIRSDGTNWIASTPTLPTTAGGAGTILRSDGTNWLTTTSTFADTYLINTILYNASANTVSGLATANNGLLVTSATGVPSILAGPGTTGNILQSNAAAAPSFSSATYPSSTTANNILFSSSANIVGQIAAVNGGVLVSNNLGVPSMLANPAAAGKVLQSANAAIPTWSTPTYPSASGTAGKVLISDGTNNVYSTPTYPNASASAGKVLISDGTNFVASTPTYPNASATARKILVSDGTNFVASTETYAVPGALGNVMVSDGTNWTAGALTNATGYTVANLADVAWTDFSGTIGYTGFTGTPTTTLARSKQIGKTLFFEIVMTGTSNATGFTITGMPATAARTTGASSAVLQAVNNGTSAFNVQYGTNSNTVLTLYLGNNSAGWTNTGTKAIAFQGFYETT